MISSSPVCLRLATIVLTLSGLVPTLAHAVDSPPSQASPSEPQLPAATPVPATPRPPYSLPWQLRLALPATVIRPDVSLAIREDMNGNHGSTAVTTLLGAVQVAPPFAVFARVGVLHDTSPAGEAAASFLNPLVGAMYSVKPLPELPMAFSLGITLPVGMGGGNTPDPSVAAATRAGFLARASMDNGLFAVNDLAIAPAVDIAYVAHGFTLQAEALLAQLIRVRGENFNPDSARTSATFGLHAGYFFAPEFSIGAEIRHQRWVSTPKLIAADTTGTLRDTTSFAVGPRFQLNLGRSATMRPGIVYMRGLDNPMTAQGYHIVMLDLLIRFNFVATGAGG
jgi:hypothetical protein